MLDTEKYLNTTNFLREDENKFGWKVGQIAHVARSILANRYNYCGYPETEVPKGARVRIIGIKQTDLNALSSKDGIGDVYVDFEFLDHFNDDGTMITCGNRHAWTLCEANPDFGLCPDGSGDLGYFRSEGQRNPGMWESLEGKRIEDHPEHGYVQYRPRKVVDPAQYI